MIAYDVVQRSPEWYSLRIGIPTASSFDKIITPKTAKLSKSAEKFATMLVTELYLKQSIDMIDPTYWMERGQILEQEALDQYAFAFAAGEACKKVGFITDDAHHFGCSPDCLIGDEGLLEIKCPKPETHMDYLLRGTIEDDYYPQAQGQLYITGRQWVDLYSYHPDLPPACVRTIRDDAYIEKLSSALGEFREMMDAKIRRLVEMGHMQLEIEKPTAKRLETVGDIIEAPVCAACQGCGRQEDASGQYACTSCDGVGTC
jgi:hypothetical protein